eukprot:SRR837773.5646.p2 GENE.SRR837773.5646~~SRR837773.5646.p2  ORF type:complete len:212 (+),score=63.93 SRR837773.5646:89-637(+)
MGTAASQTEEDREYVGKNTAEVLEVSSPELAAALWRRLGRFVEAMLEVPQEGRYEAVGVVPTFRFMRYAGGQAFKAHVDPSRYFVADPRTGEKGTFKSFVTFALYLNDAEDFEGGALNFLELVPNPSAGAGGPPLVYQSVGAVAPRRGRVAVFEHRAVHEAGAVPRGMKHMMQCDVLYRLCK